MRQKEKRGERKRDGMQKEKASATGKKKICYVCGGKCDLSLGEVKNAD